MNCRDHQLANTYSLVNKGSLLRELCTTNKLAQQRFLSQKSRGKGDKHQTEVAGEDDG
jgi:hypothetical protein